MRISEDRRWKVEERESDDGGRFGRMVRKKKGGRWKGRWEEACPGLVQEEEECIVMGVLGCMGCIWVVL